MRWDNLRLDSSRRPRSGDGGQGQLPLIERNAVARTFDTPGFRGMTFYEVHAKSIVSEVPESSRMSVPLDHQSLSGMPACVHILPAVGKRRF